ncbi:family 1 extracellular solute-binding protein [Natrinema pellirubrum DSM 15624]|uniref:Family 1 extracellular solute-binding protein n=1 Tax=Natrinema pellirubrum (strain DSM 15624 / CIP 106293 / JCM 10476 / NCIMB 786 / 157) TaxID=797303 RepID=L9YRP3_NATP1|nr:family 1 extracellular solute-binding protein [Natrinema pellirubrum DSM 15624]
MMTADSGVAGIIRDEGDGPSVQQALWDAGLDEDINIEIQTVVSNSASRMQTAQSALEAGRAPPDIHMMDSGWTVLFILRNQTVNLTEELSDDVLERVNSDYLEAILETARDPQTGDLHALPLFPDLGFTLYRQDLLEDAGYDTSGWGTDPPRWEEFASAVRDARDGAGLDYGFTTQAAAYEGLSCCTFNEVMTSWGGAYFGGTDNLFTAGERPITVDEEPVIDAIRMMRSFIEGEGSDADQYAQICPSAIVQWTEQQSLSPFADGDAVSKPQLVVRDRTDRRGRGFRRGPWRDDPAVRGLRIRRRVRGHRRHHGRTRRLEPRREPVLGSAGGGAAGPRGVRHRGGHADGVRTRGVSPPEPRAGRRSGSGGGRPRCPLCRRGPVGQRERGPTAGDRSLAGTVGAGLSGGQRGLPRRERSRDGDERPCRGTRTERGGGDYRWRLTQIRTGSATLDGAKTGSGPATPSSTGWRD